ncbi:MULTISPECIES: transporter substrate-binding domain-containing protein [Achromobacter]|jgi:polar amino acid transport system substrate-binding protein|uniref:transporter substrate-binding domain-containing protein n=1 Tax=Achromobacter TaxID=222 RepID=UPI0006C5CE62|nr:transporter substrate-binding domain-containing protein [Achromobacter kerstersii]CUJ69265.1 Sulfate starvation-induced protein 7 [Achromobacter kerstersii]
MTYRFLARAAAMLAPCAVLTGVVLASAAHAQSSPTLEKVLAANTLKCGVQLDFPPAGFRTPKNEPEGYDVAYCKDMARALGVKAEIIETPSAERIPALVSNRIDVLIASTSITPQRALSVAFSQPYLSLQNVVLTRNDAGINRYEDFKGRTIGGVTGTTQALQLRTSFDAWNDARGKFITYGSEAETYLALNQKKIDGLVASSNTADALIRSGQFPSFVTKGATHYPPDLVGIAVRLGDTALLRWVNVFVWNQVRTGRYQALYETYYGTANAPALNVAGVDF